MSVTQPTEQEKVGYLIKKLREEKGMTQEAFAQALSTSQSAVARMESGGQNLTLEQLGKISTILGRKIVSLSSDSIDFKIEGGRQLSGTIVTNTSKNGAINMICASLVNRGKTILHGMPRIEEVYRYIEIIESMGVVVRWLDQSTIEITPPKQLDIKAINREVAAKTRSFTFVGALIHHADFFLFPHSGGCKMGARTTAAYRYGLETLGVTIKTTEDDYEVTSPKQFKQNQTVALYESSDTGAIALLIAAARIPGVTTIKFAPPNYQVQDVCFLLEKMGVKIEGIGTTTLRVHGLEDINTSVEHENSEDPIEAMFFLSAAIVTKSTLTIARVPIEFMELELEKLKHMGLKYSLSKEYVSNNGRTRLVDLTVSPSALTALHDKLHTQPFPGLQNDNLPFFVPIATQAEGRTLVHDWTWENRAIYFTELNRLGASVTLTDPHRAFIEGPTKLKGAQIVCPPALRPSAIIFIAMLAAEGTSVLRNVYSISRGYAEIAERLNSIGAHIEVMRGM
ncbi:MAG: UDP-N-acetylglucosamine 1-carboxyvinyltransferase [Patescibacteria group bacterium]